MSEEPQSSTRRGVLLGVGLAGLGGALAGCSTAAVPYGANEAGVAPGEQASPSASMMGTTAAGGSMQGNGSGMGSGSSTNNSGMGAGQAGTMTTGTVLASVKEIPVGSGKIFPAHQVVVTQPTKGKFHAFSAVCTHVGCILNKIANGTIDCPCHGSEFRITDGSLVTGPANGPLPKKNIKIVEGKVVLL
ncbi:MAG TPA: Rieske (2Fe-2S) protein [Streptosporangiaceae bacterium]